MTDAITEIYEEQQRDSGTITFRVEGQPVPLARPRFNRYTKSVFTPTESQQAKEAVRAAATPYAPAEPTTGQVGVNALFTMRRPKDHYRTGKNAGKIKERYIDVPCFGKSDTDNHGKLVLDALNGLYYVDDRQVTDIMFIKRYVGEGEEPYTFCSVWFAE